MVRSRAGDTVAAASPAYRAWASPNDIAADIACLPRGASRWRDGNGRWWTRSAGARRRAEHARAETRERAGLALERGQRRLHRRELLGQLGAVVGQALVPGVDLVLEGLDRSQPALPSGGQDAGAGLRLGVDERRELLGQTRLVGHGADRTAGAVDVRLGHGRGVEREVLGAPRSGREAQHGPEAPRRLTVDGAGDVGAGDEPGTRVAVDAGGERQPGTGRGGGQRDPARPVVRRADADAGSGRG